MISLFTDSMSFRPLETILAPPSSVFWFAQAIPQIETDRQFLISQGWRMRCDEIQDSASQLMCRLVKNFK